MNSRAFALAAIICAGTLRCCVARSLPTAQTKAPGSPSAEAVRAALKPWLRAVEELSNKTGDAEVDFYLQVLRNAALMAPSAEGGAGCSAVT